MIALALTLSQVITAEAEISFEWVTVGDSGNSDDRLTDLRTPYETPLTCFFKAPRDRSQKLNLASNKRVTVC
jgi:hypothetical protein